MVFDLFDDSSRPSARGHEIGQDLSTLSVDELDERIQVLQQEIERLRQARQGKEATRAAASAFFKV